MSAFSRQLPIQAGKGVVKFQLPILQAALHLGFSDNGRRGWVGVVGVEEEGGGGGSF
jgi:hypothetical protein